MQLDSLGRYSQHGGTLHVEELLHGTGSLDFTNQAGALTFGDRAQFSLTDLSILNAGSTTVDGGQNGVLIVAPNADPSSLFGSFNFGGLVIEQGAPIHVQAGQNIAIAGTYNVPLLVEGTLSHADKPVWFRGPTTVRGTLDLIYEGSSESGLIVDGHTSTLESGVGRFNAVVGDGAASSRLELLGGEFAGNHLFVQGAYGGDAEVLVDGADGTGDLQINVATDGSAGSSATFNHRSGTLNLVTLRMGYTGYLPQALGFPGLNFSSGVPGGPNNTFNLEADAVINVRQDPQGYLRWIDIGAINGDGTFNHNGGTFNAQHGKLNLGRSQLNTGVYNMNGGFFRVGEMNIGQLGTGRFYHIGGTVIVDGQLVLANSQGGDGLYRINAGSLTAKSIVVAKSGVGVFEQRGGSVQTRQLSIGEQTQSSVLAEYRLTDGTLAADKLSLGFTSLYRGKLIQTGGTADLGLTTIYELGEYQLHGGQVNLHGTLSSDGGTIDFGTGDANLHVADGGFANFSNANILGGLNATISGSANSVISLPSSFDISQFGSFSSQGLVHYAGDELVINSDLQIRASGSFNGAITNNGTLVPGNSPGILRINGNYLQTAGSELQIEIGGIDDDLANPQYDELVVSGQATILGGTLDLNLVSNYSPELGDELAFLISDSLTGTFSNIKGVQGQPDLAPDMGLAVIYRHDIGQVIVKASLLGDTNFDELVNRRDLSAIAAGYGQQGSTWTGGDFDGNGISEFADLLWIALAWQDEGDFVTMADEEGILKEGDLTGDDAVDQVDLDMLLSSFGQSSQGYDLTRGELTGDGRVDALDLRRLLSNWTSESAPNLTIPEPNSAVVILLGALLLTRRRTSSRQTLLR